MCSIPVVVTSAPRSRLIWMDCQSGFSRPSDDVGCDLLRQLSVRLLKHLRLPGHSAASGSRTRTDRQLLGPSQEQTVSVRADWARSGRTLAHSKRRDPLEYSSTLPDSVSTTFPAITYPTSVNKVWLIKVGELLFTPCPRRLTSKDAIRKPCLHSSFHKPLQLSRYRRLCPYNTPL